MDAFLHINWYSKNSPHLKIISNLYFKKEVCYPSKQNSGFLEFSEALRVYCVLYNVGGFTALGALRHCTLIGSSILQRQGQQWEKKRASLGWPSRRQLLQESLCTVKRPQLSLITWKPSPDAATNNGKGSWSRVWGSVTSAVTS